MRKEEIFLDLAKLTKQEIKSVYNILVDNNELIYDDTINNLRFGVLDSTFNCLALDGNKWLEVLHRYKLRKEINFQQFKDLFAFKGVTSQDIRNAEEELFKDLTIGQEIEVNGYVLKVEREVSQWYVNKDTMKFIKSQHQPYGASLITDKDFINQLEKFSK